MKNNLSLDPHQEAEMEEKHYSVLDQIIEWQIKLPNKTFSALHISHLTFQSSRFSCCSRTDKISAGYKRKSCCK